MTEAPDAEDRVLLMLIEMVLTGAAICGNLEMFDLNCSKQLAAQVAGIPLSVAVHLGSGPALLGAGRQGAWEVRFRLPGWYFQVWHTNIAIRSRWPLHRVPDIARIHLDDTGGTMRRDLAVMALLAPAWRTQPA